MKIISKKVALLALSFTLFSIGGNVEASVKKESKPIAEGFLPAPSKNGEMSAQAGVYIAAETEAYLVDGDVNTWGETQASQSVPDIRVSNYLYQGDYLIDWARDMRSGNFAFAFGGRTPYVSGKYYHGSSLHYVMDQYGQTWRDNTIDSDL